jgi:hypothetical protein
MRPLPSMAYLAKRRTIASASLQALHFLWPTEPASHDIGVGEKKAHSLVPDCDLLWREGSASEMKCGNQCLVMSWSHEQYGTEGLVICWYLHCWLLWRATSRGERKSMSMGIVSHCWGMFGGGRRRGSIVCAGFVFLASCLWISAVRSLPSFPVVYPFSAPSNSS